MPGIDINVQGQCGFTALMGAVCGNHSSIATRLLKVEGINVGLLNQVGNSAVDLAVERSQARNSWSLVDQLASAPRVDVNTTHNAGRTALSHAAEHGAQVTFPP
jgi:ankyrin repeat protein